MDETAVRLAVVAGALLVAAAASQMMRMSGRGKTRSVADANLASGVYLFTSSACSGCTQARRRLTDSLGADRFVEVGWESEPGEFHRLAITAVPATLIVQDDGSASLYPGKPDKALKSLSP
ncbi:MAG: hypothetical protein ACR2NL_05870 [Acidimicrobiia bacterium]